MQGHELGDTCRLRQEVMATHLLAGEVTSTKELKQNVRGKVLDCGGSDVEGQGEEA